MSYTNRLISFIAVLCLITSCRGTTVVLADGDASLPSVSGIYIDGAPVVGETLTMNYTINNPDGSLDNLSDNVKWYKQKDKYYLRNDDNNNDNSGSRLQTGGLTFTIPDDDSLIGKYISVTIPMASVGGNGRIRTMGVGPIGEGKSDDMISSSVTIVAGNENGVGANCGDKLSGRFVEPDCAYTCQWYASSDENGTYAPIDGATDDEYVIPGDMYGKYIRFGIIPEDGNVLMSDNIALAGNAAFGAFVSGDISGYAGSALNALTNGISLQQGGGLYTYGGVTTPEHYVTVDLGKSVEIADVMPMFLSVASVDYFVLECSLTGEDGSWTRMQTETPMPETDSGIKMDSRTSNLSTTYTARYIRILFTHSKNIIFSEIAVMAKGNKAPVIALEGDSVINLLKGEQYTEPGYSAYDPEDGDITDSVVVSGFVDTEETGEYTIVYSVTDGVNTSTATRTINVSNGFPEEGDMAYGKNVESSYGTTPEALVDGNKFTSWHIESGRSIATIDLGSEEFVTQIKLEETGNSIIGFKLYASADNSSYSLVAASNNGMGSFSKSVSAVSARYLKLTVDSEGEGAINSFCCYYDGSGADTALIQPSVSGVYIDGAPVIGQTLTLNYRLNNPDGSLDNLGERVKWYKQTDKYYLRNVDANNDYAENLLQTGSLTYTIPNDANLIGKYISVTIPVASVEGNGRMRTVGVGPVYGAKSDDMISSSVTIVAGNTNGTGGDIGDKLFADFVEPDASYGCQWYFSNAENSTYTAIPGATKREFVITDDLYGKYVKFGITLDEGSVLMSDNAILAGNAAFGAFVYGNISGYAGSALNALTNGISSNQGGGIYTYGGVNSPDHSVTVDLGRDVEVSDVIATFASSADVDYYVLDCSVSGEDGTWERMETQNGVEGSDNGIIMTSKTSALRSTYTARYIRISFTHSKNIIFSELAVISKEDKVPTLVLSGGDVVNVLINQEYKEPGYTAYDPEDGDLTSEVTVSGDVNVNRLGEYTLTYSVTDLSVRSHTVTATRTVNVCNGFKKDGDLAYAKNVTASSGISPEALVDGNEFTSWEFLKGESTAVIDLGSEELISKIEVCETGNNIGSFELYALGDSEEYFLIASSDDGMGNYIEDIDIVRARYLKLKVNCEKSDGKINTFCCYFDDFGKVRYAADMIEIDADLDNVTENLPLPDKGEFGTAISWKSDDTSVISNNGTVYKATSGKNVVLTATVSLGETSTTRDFDVSVKKISSDKNSGGGGGGGKGSSVSIPPIPVVVEKPLVSDDIAQKGVFSDLSDEHWAYEYISSLYELRLVSGFGDGTFRPDVYLTRAQYLKMILESLGLSADGVAGFSDVNENDWYYRYVASAVSLGIVNGLGDGSFGADLPVSRQDMAVISARALECVDLLPEFASTSVFADYDSISGYAVEAVGRMSNAEIISGDTTGAFRPQDTATRAEAAKIAYHLYEMKVEG